MPPRKIYPLSPRQLSAETIAVAFAKTSRSPESFREIAAQLSEESSAQFHEKWVVGYGHASVAEHAVLHLAFENISRVAVEVLESSRLASFTEKSTRYQKWGGDDFTIPPELDSHPLRDTFIQAARGLFSAYADSLAPAKSLVLRRSPRRENESDEAYDRRIRSQYVDACRFLLPAAANANVGMTANARVIEMMIRKMLSHPLMEVRQIGEQAKEVAKRETPTLVKYAEAAPYVVETMLEIQSQELEIMNQAAGDWCTLVDYRKDGEEKILAAALYRFGEMSYADALSHIKGLKSSDGLEQLARALLGRLSRHDVPLRELEYADYAFDLILDQGAYVEFKRHRMMTQTPQRLTARLGYAAPRLLEEAGFAAQYHAAMQSAAEAYEKLYALDAHVAQYIVPNGFHRRVLAQFNLREAFAFCRLRSAANAHFSIRRVAQRMYEEIARVHPLLAQYLHLPKESWQEIEKNYFSG